MKRTARRIDRSVLGSFAAPLQLLFPVLLFRAAIPPLEVSALLRLDLERGLDLLLLSSIAWICIRIVDAFLLGLRSVLATRKSAFSYSVLPLASRILKLTILVFAITAILADWATIRRLFWRASELAALAGSVLPSAENH